MEKEQLYKDVKHIITDLSDLKEEELGCDSKLREDLELDSLVVLEILGALELKYRIQFPESQLRKANTLGDLIDLIQKLSRPQET